MWWYTSKTFDNLQKYTDYGWNNYNIPRYTEILEVNLFAFVYRLFHEDFSPIYEALQYVYNM